MNQTKTNKNTDLCSLLYEPHSNLPFQVLFEQARQPLPDTLEQPTAQQHRSAKTVKTECRVNWFELCRGASCFASEPE